MDGTELMEVWLPWAMVIIGAVCLLAYCPSMWHLRSNAVAAAGQLRLKATRPRAGAWWFGVNAALVCIALFMLATVLIEASRLRQILPFLLMYLMFWSLSLFERLVGIAPRGLEIRERGVVTHGANFWAWDRVKSYRWEDRPIPVLYVRFARYGSAANRIRADQKEAVETLLQQHLPAAANPQEPQGPAPPDPRDG